MQKAFLFPFEGLSPWLEWNRWGSDSCRFLACCPKDPGHAHSTDEQRGPRGDRGHSADARNPSSVPHLPPSSCAPHSFIQQIKCTYCVPGTVNKTGKTRCPQGVSIPKEPTGRTGAFPPTFAFVHMQIGGLICMSESPAELRSRGPPVTAPRAASSLVCLDPKLFSTTRPSLKNWDTSQESGLLASPKQAADLALLSSIPRWSPGTAAQPKCLAPTVLSSRVLLPAHIQSAGPSWL